MSISRTSIDDGAINIHLSQTGRRVAVATQVRLTLGAVSQVAAAGAVRADYGQPLSVRDTQVIPVVRFTTLTKKYQSYTGLT